MQLLNCVQEYSVADAAQVLAYLKRQLSPLCVYAVETRKIVKKLFEDWMRPIVLDAEREDEKKRNKQVDLEAHRAQQRAKQEEAAAMKARQTEPKAPLQPHEPGFRWVV